MRTTVNTGAARVNGATRIMSRPGNSATGMAQAAKDINRSEDANQITPRIFLGNSTAANDLKWLKANGITHIINMAAELPNYHPDHFYYFNQALNDDPTFMNEDLFAVLEPTHRYMHGVLAVNTKSRILVHCHMGISRSSSVVIYHLMRAKRLSFEEALKEVRKRRPIVNPNASYSKQLRDISKLLLS